MLESLTVTQICLSVLIGLNGVLIFLLFRIMHTSKLREISHLDKFNRLSLALYNLELECFDECPQAALTASYIRLEVDKMMASSFRAINLNNGLKDLKRKQSC